VIVRMDAHARYHSDYIARSVAALAATGADNAGGAARPIWSRPTTDAKAALAGSMLPAGGVKGAMLALSVELLVCALSGAAYGFESDSFFAEEGRPTRIGQAILAIDPRALAGNEVYLERVETLVQAMSADPEVRLPGERRRRNAEQARREGVIIPDDLMARIRALAGEASNA